MELFHYFSRYEREKMRKKQLLWLKKFFGRRPVLFVSITRKEDISHILIIKKRLVNTHSFVK